MLNFKNNKWFSLIEIVFVLLILSILFVAFQNFFAFDDRDYIRSQWCVNTVYWQIKNFFDNASTGKWLYTWDQMYYPDKYLMSFSWEPENEINFKFLSGFDFTHDDVDDLDFLHYKTISLDWDSGISQHYCYDNSAGYHINLTWSLINDDTEYIRVNKMLHWTVDDPPFQITSQWSEIDRDDFTNLTWDIKFIFEQWDFERVISRIEFDRRVNKIYHNRCVYRWEDYSTCQDWSQ